MSVDYFNKKAISASGINTFLNKSPYHYWKSSPFNPNAEPFEPTPQMEFGTLCHLLLLENEKFAEQYAIIPDADKRTKEGKEAYAEFEERLGNRKAVKREIYTKALNMIEALKSHKSAFKLLKTGFAEQEVFWKDEETGLDCKSKLDYAREGLIVDYKTSSDASPEGFAKALANFGYHRQDGIYREAYKAKFGKEAIGMLFIVQDANDPDCIGIYNVDESSRLIAEEEVRYAKKEIKQRLENNNWEFTDYKAQTVMLPSWYQSKAGI